MKVDGSDLENSRPILLLGRNDDIGVRCRRGSKSKNSSSLEKMERDE